VERSEISTGVLVAAIVLPFLFILGVTVFVFRHHVFKNMGNKTAPELASLGIMSSPLLERDNSQHQPLHNMAAECHFAGTQSSAVEDILNSSGVRLDDWQFCNTCQLCAFVTNKYQTFKRKHINKCLLQMCLLSENARERKMARATSIYFRGV